MDREIQNIILFFSDLFYEIGYASQRFVNYAFVWDFEDVIEEHFSGVFASVLLRIAELFPPFEAILDVPIGVFVFCSGLTVIIIMTVIKYAFSFIDVFK